MFFTQNADKIIALSKEYAEEAKSLGYNSNDPEEEAEKGPQKQVLYETSQGEPEQGDQEPRSQPQDEPRDPRVIRPYYRDDAQATVGLREAYHPGLPGKIMIPSDYEVESVEQIEPRQQQTQREELVMSAPNPLALPPGLAQLDAAIARLQLSDEEKSHGPSIPVITITGMAQDVIYEQQRAYPNPAAVPVETKEAVEDHPSLSPRQKGYVNKVLDNYFSFLTDLHKRGNSQRSQQPQGRRPPQQLEPQTESESSPVEAKVQGNGEQEEEEAVASALKHQQAELQRRFGRMGPRAVREPRHPYASLP